VSKPFDFTPEQNTGEETPRGTACPGHQALAALALLRGQVDEQRLLCSNLSAEPYTPKFIPPSILCCRDSAYPGNER
jgi:hypothetical protein